MSGLRPGSAEAKILFSKRVNKEVFEEWLQFDDEIAYADAVQRVANNKNRPDLIELDRFINLELHRRVIARSPPHITHAELADIMKWKLARGQMRPLQKLVESNAASVVVEVTTRCFVNILGTNDEACTSSSQSSLEWERGLQALCELKGIGIATATAVLAVFLPALCPFMADEVIDAVVVDEKRDYTLKIYKKLQSLMVKKAEELNRFTQDDYWTAEKVGKALWVCAKRSSLSPILNEVDTRKRTVVTAEATSLDPDCNMPKTASKKRKPTISR